MPPKLQHPRAQVAPPLPQLTRPPQLPSCPKEPPGKRCPLHPVLTRSIHRHRRKWGCSSPSNPWPAAAGEEHDPRASKPALSVERIASCQGWGMKQSAQSVCYTTGSHTAVISEGSRSPFTCDVSQLRPCQAPSGFTPGNHACLLCHQHARTATPPPLPGPWRGELCASPGVPPCVPEDFPHACVWPCGEMSHVTQTCHRYMETQQGTYWVLNFCCSPSPRAPRAPKSKLDGRPHGCSLLSLSGFSTAA